MNPSQDFEGRLAATLSELRGAGLLRQMRLPGGIDLVSNDYLGLADHPHLAHAMRAALEHVPAGSGGSRLLRGHHDIFERIEERLAAFSGTDSALLFGSGYAANIGLLQAIVLPDDLVVSDERNHASLIDGIRLTKARTVVYPHQDLQALETALRMPRRGRAIVMTESVFSMDGDRTPLATLSELVERHGGVLVVDEAHATGLYGARGSGCVEELGLRDRVIATIHTGGKALGSGGAWVAGSRALYDVMVNRARSFIFSTAPLPVVAAALGAGLELVQQEPQRRADVHRKAALLRRALSGQNILAGGDSPIVPVIAGSNEAALALQSGLMAAGFDVRAIRPPSVAPGTARLRVTVRYPVSDDDLGRFAVEAGRLMMCAVPDL
ncbi:MAG TPA: 8-amino-7-oxononanoate synthase [Vicinamibacterales bacterium]|nr:8-amino-7-oxononanoate synthase [Vicinamibacterales bacterium]